MKRCNKEGLLPIIMIVLGTLILLCVIPVWALMACAAIGCIAIGLLMLKK